MAINSSLHHHHLFYSLPCKSSSSSTSNISSLSHIMYAPTLPKLCPTPLNRHASCALAKMPFPEEADARSDSGYNFPSKMLAGSSLLASEHEKIERGYEGTSRMHDKGRILRSDSTADGRARYSCRKRNALVRKDSDDDSFDRGKDDEISTMDKVLSTLRGPRYLNGQSDKRLKIRNKEADDVTSTSKIREGTRTARVVKKDVQNSKSLRKIKRNKIEPLDVEFRIGLDMCSKRGDVLGAISFYDKACKEEIKLEQYHYNVLLYLCSSAAGGIVLPAKSGSGGSSNSSLSNPKLKNGLSVSNSNDFSDNLVHNISVQNKDLEMNISKTNEDLEIDISKTSTLNVRVYNGFPKGGNKQRFTGKDMNSSESSSSENEISIDKTESASNEHKDRVVEVSDEVKSYALARGFEIYERLCEENIPLSEAALTSVARMAITMNDCDMAFEMVKKMKDLGINPRLRSYGPALFCFCNDGNVEKAFEVEKHMLSCGIYPEEPELEALLRMCVLANRGDKVYYLLHKLRTSVRQVSSSTADLIERWFDSKAATRMGKRKWDEREVLKAIENVGGGWHGLGWLGRGKWMVKHAKVVDHGVCTGCGEKLTTIDLDPIETDNFAKSVAAIAAKRERNLSFQNFQKWLDYYGPFEAVIDAANVGLSSQKFFSLAKVNAIANGLRQKLQKKRFPLIIVHNRRVSGGRMEAALNKTIIEKWKNFDALYATPNGSNDDWYWLYAAIKSKGLMITNDEMRDHIFQLLGNDFFPKWKERHQVRFSFSEGGPEFHMPPPCSVVIQESAKGHWHIPVMMVNELARETRWLCVTRANLHTESKNKAESEGTCTPNSKAQINSEFNSKAQVNSEKLKITASGGDRSQTSSPKKNRRTRESQKPSSLTSELEAAEKLAGMGMNFEI